MTAQCLQRHLDRALSLGITLFETSDSYGKGKMEQRLEDQTEAAAEARAAVEPRRQELMAELTGSREIGATS